MVHGAALALHIASGTTALVLGPIAMFAPKRRGLHTRIGDAYHWVFVAVAASALVLAALDLSRLWWLGLIGLFSYSFALLGYLAAKRRWRGWLGAHISGQGGSYIALVTALLVVNVGADDLIVWFIPTIVGSPLIAWVRYQVATGRRPKAIAGAPAVPQPTRG
jgi:uncharacterized membrane protein